MLFSELSFFSFVVIGLNIVYLSVVFVLLLMNFCYMSSVLCGEFVIMGYYLW